MWRKGECRVGRSSQCYQWLSIDFRPVLHSLEGHKPGKLKVSPGVRRRDVASREDTNCAISHNRLVKCLLLKDAGYQEKI